MSHIDVFAFLGICAIALFSFLSVATWSDNRRREREAYYGNETLRKMMEMASTTPEAVKEFVHEQQVNALRRRREGLKLGGLVTFAVGVGTMIFLAGAPGPTPIHVIGIIPVLIGVVLLFYAYVLAPRV